MATWYTVEEAEQEWSGLGGPDAEQMQLLLDVSQSECLAFSPVSTPDIPDGHRWAHLQHARNIWNAQKANPSGNLGDDMQGFGITVYPMDWAVRARLRPRVIFGGAVG